MAKHQCSQCMSARCTMVHSDPDRPCPACPYSWRRESRGYVDAAPEVDPSTGAPVAGRGSWAEILGHPFDGPWYAVDAHPTEPDPWAIAPLGTIRGDAHYPSTAELAAFRRRIAPPTGRGWSLFAYEHERQHGIGYRIAADPLYWNVPSIEREARREAGWDREARYTAGGMRSTLLVPVHPRSGGAWQAERVDGAPYQWHRLGR